MHANTLKDPPRISNWTAFREDRIWATDSPQNLATRIKEAIELGQGSVADTGLVVFDDLTGLVMDLDLRGTLEDVSARFPHRPDGGEAALEEQVAAPGRKPGRPKLGVISREVTLLPRHWEWLNEQPGGASIALRKLVEAARNSGGAAAEKRKSAEAAYRFITTMAGNLADYEEAVRALFAGEREKFRTSMSQWPDDVRQYADKLACAAFSSPEPGIARN